MEPSTSKFIPLLTTLSLLEPLGIACRLVCRVRHRAKGGAVLTVTARDPDPVVALYDRDWRPWEGRALSERKQVGPETFEYDLPLSADSLRGEFIVRLSHGEQHRDVAVSEPVATLVVALGWGRDIVGREADAAVEAVELAWAVTELLTEAHRPAPQVGGAYARLHAAAVRAAHFNVNA